MDAGKRNWFGGKNRRGQKEDAASPHAASHAATPAMDTVRLASSQPKQFTVLFAERANERRQRMGIASSTSNNSGNFESSEADAALRTADSPASASLRSSTTFGEEAKAGSGRGEEAEGGTIRRDFDHETEGESRRQSSFGVGHEAIAAEDGGYERGQEREGEGEEVSGAERNMLHDTSNVDDAGEEGATPDDENGNNLESQNRQNIENGENSFPRPINQPLKGPGIFSKSIPEKRPMQSGIYTREFERVAMGGKMPSFEDSIKENSKSFDDNEKEESSIQKLGTVEERAEVKFPDRFKPKVTEMKATSGGNFTDDFSKIRQGGAMPKFPESKAPLRKARETAVPKPEKKVFENNMGDGFTAKFSEGKSVPSFPDPKKKSKDTWCCGCFVSS